MRISTWTTTLCLALACAGLTAPALALDQVFTSKGTINGTVAEISPNEVKVKKPGAAGETVSVPINELVSIKFDGEKPEVNLARSAVLDGRHADGLRMFGELQAKVAGDRLEVQQDVQFYLALATAQLALAGSGDIKDAGRMMSDFVKAHPGSYHYYQANEVLGDLLVANGSYDAALPYYDKVSAAPWSDFKMRAGVAKGRALRAQKKPAEALAAFEQVLGMGGAADDPLVKSQLLQATLGKAACQAETDQVEEAIGLVEQVIKEANPEEAEVHALAYTTLGNCYRKANRSKDALLAFLHVDVLYPVFPQAHAEALSNLVALWTEMKQADRAQEAAATLQSRYANSPWAKSGG